MIKSIFAIAEELDNLTLGINNTKQEHYWAWYLDNEYKYLGMELIAKGLNLEVSIEISSIFRAALEKGAAFIVTGHNHVDDTTMYISGADYEHFSRLRECGELINILVIASIISNGNNHICVGLK